MWRKNNQAQIRRQFRSQEGEIKASRNLKKKTDPLETASEAEKKKNLTHFFPYTYLHLEEKESKLHLGREEQRLCQFIL